MADPAETTSSDAVDAEHDKPSTPDTILAGAFRILARDGFQALTARNVAQEAGTNLALVNYYFGGKKGLLIALYDHLERDRYQRQAALYADDGEPLSSKWRRAVDYYKRDLEDGFVRVHHELLAQGFADDDLAAPARRRSASWSEMLHDAARRYLPKLGLGAAPADAVLILSAFWYGMEQQHLIRSPEERLPYFDLLERVGDWLEEREKEIESQEKDGGSKKKD